MHETRCGHGSGGSNELGEDMGLEGRVDGLGAVGLSRVTFKF